ncbi:MAG: Re/Si-specific NAD(P)(+) transhydrogenase subunit alpha [Alphaproteobacteria bacterium]|nr:Re/Si-specific NAD(P)(+) transhydrogenase subunit alpha [Alphaproteobacteria bacterium]
MKIAAAKESSPLEARVALTPDTAKKFVAAGITVTVEAGAGLGSGISDQAYEAAGAQVAPSAGEAYRGADIVLCVDTPDAAGIALIPQGAILVGMMNPLDPKTRFTALNERSIHAYAMEFLPRISRAQSMDVLSSQSNLAGYRAVIEAVAATSKTVPMMMTAAGTIPPAKALVLGAGVAGLQAIATAKRLGAVVSAFDVRAAVKEQVQSLGAKFVEVAAAEDAQTSGGYAKEMDDDYKRRQEAAIAEVIKTQDIIISTALIPGKPAPELITGAMVASMKPGSVIVDLAAANGGNCKLTRADEVIVTDNGVTIIGYTNMPSRAASDASPLYARNLQTFVMTLMFDKETKTLKLLSDDELIKGTLITKGGAVVHPALAK